MTELAKSVKFDSGAVRGADVAGSAGKFPARFDLISAIGLRRLAETYGEGSLKYDDNNWRKGIPMSNIMNHLLAHAVAYQSGDRSEDHLGHLAWNAFALMEFEETRQDLNDLWGSKAVAPVSAPTPPAPEAQKYASGTNDRLLTLAEVQNLGQELRQSRLTELVRPR